MAEVWCIRDSDRAVKRRKPGADTPGLSLFLTYYFQYTKWTITHLHAISFLEVVWFEGCGRVLHKWRGLTMFFGVIWRLAMARQRSCMSHPGVEDPTHENGTVMNWAPGC
jgi:hypothetical protein